MVMGNMMSLREFAQSLERVQTGQTTPADEMCRNLLVPVETGLISSPGELSDDDIERLYRDEGVPSE